MSEDLIVRHCAPTLAGLKTGNMFTACEASLSGKKSLCLDPMTGVMVNGCVTGKRAANLRERTLPVIS